MVGGEKGDDQQASTKKKVNDTFNGQRGTSTQRSRA